MLLASIDHTLASVRSALAAGADPEQEPEARKALSGRAGADVARLVASTRREEWADAPAEVKERIDRSEVAVREGDLEGVERVLVEARERLGGRSR